MHRMEAKIKSGTFLAESCGRVSIVQKYHFFDAAPMAELTFMK